MSKEAFKDQLANVRKAVRNRSIPANPGTWKKEGEDHININRYSETELGRLLNLDNARHWEHPLLGPFRSLNSLWFFLKAKYKSDALRSMTGKELKEHVSKYCGGQIGRVPNFRAVILDSAYHRVKSCPDILKKVLASTLPFDCYRVLDSGVCVRFEHSEWFAAGYEEIRKALKENRAPDFKKYSDAKGDIYAAALELISPGYAEKAKVAEEPVEKPKKPKGETPVYDPSKIKNLDVQVEKPVVEKADVVEVAPVKEVLPDYKLAAAENASPEAVATISVDASEGSACTAVAAVINDNGALLISSILNCEGDEITSVNDGGGPIEEDFISVTREESGITAVLPDEAAPVNALQAALMSSGLAADSYPVVEETPCAGIEEDVVVPEATGRYSPD